jgi:hypothetical protein
MKTSKKSSPAQDQISEKGIDSLNLDSAKINIKKADLTLATREGIKSSNKSLYRGFDDLSTEDQKKRRQKIRRDLNRFVADILGKDRKDEEREKSIGEFLIFYKENWKITDFRMENFSQKKNKEDLKDYAELLEFIKGTLE